LEDLDEFLTKLIKKEDAGLECMKYDSNDIKRINTNNLTMTKNIGLVN